jgi:hypothetical protein
MPLLPQSPQSGRKSSYHTSNGLASMRQRLNVGQILSLIAIAFTRQIIAIPPFT